MAKRSAENKTRPFRKLALEAAPELWSFQVFSGLVLLVLSSLLMSLIDLIAESNGTTITSANLKSLFLSWRLPALLGTCFLLVSVFVIFEILAQVHLSHDILRGERVSVWRELKKALPDIRRFWNLSGIGLFVFVFLAVPLTGIGFGISLTESFHIPNFISTAILHTPFYLIGIIALYIYLIITGILWLFVFHAVLIDGMSPAAGKKHSARLIKEHWKELLKHFLQFLLVFVLAYAAFYAVFHLLPESLLIRAGAELPKGYELPAGPLFSAQALSPEEKSILAYRILSVMYVLFNNYLSALFFIFAAAYFMLFVTREYLALTRGSITDYPPRPKKTGYVLKAAAFFGIILLLVPASFLLGNEYSAIFVRKEPVRIVAHRCGGSLAPENSMEGIAQAISLGLYGSETDIQRTKDGAYIINHDETFKRLCGVSKAPADMNLAEIKTLTIRDGMGEAQVPVLSDMLDAIKGKETLFIELKGKTADKKMADDVVRMVREKDCVENVVLISLKYDVIEYAEDTYPEFETGILVYAGLGHVTRLHCDILIMEEEMASVDRIDAIKGAGKKAIAWTVNTKEGMEKYFDSDVDAIITDEVALALQTQEELAGRTDLEVIEAGVDAAIDRAVRIDDFIPIAEIQEIQEKTSP